MARSKVKRHSLDCVVHDWDYCFSVSEKRERITHQNVRESAQTLVIFGTIEKAYKSCTNVEIFTFPAKSDAAKLVTAEGYPPSVGHIEKKKSILNAGIMLADAEFQALYSLACAGQLKFCSLSIDGTSGRSVSITSFSISNKKIE